MADSKLYHLVELAAEPSSHRRRELLREVTDLFFAGEEVHNSSEMELFDDVLGQLSREMEEAVRVELAHRMGQTQRAPRRLISDLAGMLRSGHTTRFLVALSELADVDFHTARRILQRKELDALAIICKAADFDRALFLTFAILILDADADAMGRARQYGDLYSELPKDAATRTIRFWRMRRNTGDGAAA